MQMVLLSSKVLQLNVWSNLGTSNQSTLLQSNSLRDGSDSSRDIRNWLSEAPGFPAIATSSRFMHLKTSSMSFKYSNVCEDGVAILFLELKSQHTATETAESVYEFPVSLL
ncbi:hypothetical protein O6H91_21G062400 [Diphasiastrum complanatum]|uniref:Uncharacterized protein n=1 Tax=Diphasiastrum complanatum TaxID=34168 RepID=A0ACC2AL63_DIPCM|nr:hypothetical protein O6H91_21G062400 [Diphasiastrum complanatum]